MWLYAGYLGAGRTNAPFECFAGLWGVAFLTQGQGWDKNAAAWATTALACFTVITQFLGGPVSSYWPSFRQRMGWLTFLAACGLLGFASFLYSGDGLLPVPLVVASIALLGVSVGSSTVVWAAISTDPLCQGVATSGLVSGFCNTICIFVDGGVQTLVGVVLDLYYDGGHAAGGGNGTDSAAGNGTTDRVYSSLAFARAFLVLAAMYLIAVLCASGLLCIGTPRKTTCE